MTDIICPLCGKANPPELIECQYCGAPIKTGGFLPPAGPEESPISPDSGDASKRQEPAKDSGSTSPLEQSIPDWLKETEAGFLASSESKPDQPAPDQVSQQIEALLNTPASPVEQPENAIDDDWLARLLAEAGAVETPQPEPPAKKSESIELEESGQEILPEGTDLENISPIEGEIAFPTPPEEKPDWLTSLEASSKLKLEGGMFAAEPEAISPELHEVPEEKAPELPEQPEWLTKPIPEAPVESLHEPEESIAPAELPGWLEPLRPPEPISPTGPVEDVSAADIVTAGPLTGLRGVISPQPSAIRVQKPPTYSIRLRVTDEQQSRMQLMEQMLAEEGKPSPLPSQPIITSRYIFRLIVALILLLPIIWMIVSNSQKSSTPQPENVPGVVDFIQHIQALPSNALVLMAFDYEPGFSGELNTAVTSVLSQLMSKNAYLALVSTTPSGPALAESLVKSASSNLAGNVSTYKNYADLGYIPGGTVGLLGLATSPRSILTYAMDESDVWAATPLISISTVKDFAAVVVITNDPDTARIWIEQVGRQLSANGTPMLLITSSQAEPLIRPYYEATPAQVQGLLAGLAGGVAYASMVGNNQVNGIWDAYAAGVTISILIILIGSIVGIVVTMLPADKGKAD